MTQSRKLAAIMFTDIVGYTSLMGEDEQKAFELLRKNRQIQKPIIEQFHGQWLKEMGDGVLASFSTISDAVNCAKEIQKTCQSEPDLKLRIGIHQGEVVFEENDVFGDGVNIASRLEPLAPPGGIMVSESVNKNLINKKDIETVLIGEETLKGVKEPIKVYLIKIPGASKLQDVPFQIEIPKASGLPKPRKILFGISTLLMLTLIYLWYGRGSADETQVEKSIAVLPLDIIGGDPEGEYFAAGVREEILNHLNLLENLQVKSRSVVDRAGEGLNTEELMAKLKLTHFIEGSTQKVGNRVRITVQLIDANTNDHLWSESYDRDYDNLLETQTDIARKVAEELSLTISPEVVNAFEKKPTENPMAWDDYLKAQYYFRKYYAQREPDDLKQTVMFLKSSIDKAPDFALGYSLLALSYQQQPQDPGIVFDFINPDSVLVLCNKAIALDSTLSNAYVVRGDYNAYTTGFAHRDKEAAENDYKKALKIDPNDPYAHWRIGNFYGGYGGNWELTSALKYLHKAINKQPEPWLLANILNEIGWIYLEVADYHKANQYMEKALSYDPENIFLMGYISQLYKVTREYKKLYELSQKVMEISPLNQGLWDLGQYYLLVGDYPQSVEYFNKYFSKASATAVLGTMYNKHMYGYALLKTGYEEKAKQQFDEVLQIIRDQGHPTPDYEFAKIYAAKNELDSAYYYLEKAVNGPIRWGMSDFMVTDPLFENIKDEPKFQKLVAVAREKVRKKRKEIQELEASGEIPASIVELELF